MGKQDNLDEEMTVELNLDDGTTVVCAVFSFNKNSCCSAVVFKDLADFRNNADLVYVIEFYIVFFNVDL